MWKNVVLGLSIALMSAGISFAQDADPAANFPKPGPEHAKLKDLVGDWDAVMSMETPGGKMSSKCTATYKSICGGMWIASDFEGAIGPQKFQGHGLDGYDAAKKKFVSVWVDSMSGSPMTLEGNFDKDGKLVMTGETTGHDGKPEKVKTITEGGKTKDEFTFSFFMVKDGKDVPAFSIAYKRKK